MQDSNQVAANVDKVIFWPSRAQITSGPSRAVVPLTDDLVQDSNQVAANMEKVNFWSIVHMTLILVVGFIQVSKKYVKVYFKDESLAHFLTVILSKVANFVTGHFFQSSKLVLKRTGIFRLTFLSWKICNFLNDNNFFIFQVFMIRQLFEDRSLIKLLTRA
jgi:hypothetical protein